MFKRQNNCATSQTSVSVPLTKTAKSDWEAPPIILGTKLLCPGASRIVKCFLSVSKNARPTSTVLPFSRSVFPGEKKGSINNQRFNSFLYKRTRKRNTKHRERGRIKNPLKDPFSCIQQITIFKELGGMECNWPNRTQRKKFVFLVKMFFSNTESVQSQTITTSKFQESTTFKNLQRKRLRYRKSSGPNVHGPFNSGLTMLHGISFRFSVLNLI